MFTIARDRVFLAIRAGKRSHAQNQISLRWSSCFFEAIHCLNKRLFDFQ